MQYSLLHLSMRLATLAQISPSRKADSATMADASSRKSVVKRLKVLKTAWILSSGDVTQAWFSENASKKVLIARLHSGLAAFAANPSVTQPVGLKEAIMAEDFDLNTCLTKFGLDWEKAKAKLKSRKYNASWHRGLHTQKTTKLVERLKLLKTAWIHGNGELPQPWFLQVGSKEVLITRLHAGLAAFADDNSMTLPVGVKEAVMAEDFDFDRCLTRFGFSWEKARAKLQGQPDQHQEKTRARAKARLSERLKNQSEVASKADYECSRECISPGACTAPCSQGPLHRNCLQSHVNHVRKKVDRTFKKAKRMMKSLEKSELVERLIALKAAWILGSGRMPQPWCRFGQHCNKKHLMSKLRSGFQAIAAKRTVKLPAGFSDDMADNFHFDNCMTRLQKESTANRIGFGFNYKNEFYQDVKHFCNNYNGLKQSAATADVVNTNFPKSAYLVVPGRSKISAAMKNGKADLSTLKGSAYILRNKEKPTRPYLLLVSLTALHRAAAAAIISKERRKHSVFIAREERRAERAAKERERKRRSKSVMKDSWKCK